MGSKTNKNGLRFEVETNLMGHSKLVYVKFHPQEDSPIFIAAPKNNLDKYMIAHRQRANVGDGHGCKKPDECYINEAARIIFIIEKKFQNCSGSACEKIQTAEFKRWQYSQMYPNYKIVYIYCLSSWFKKKCKKELEYLNLINVPVFFGDDDNYRELIIDFLVNYTI